MSKWRVKLKIEDQIKWLSHLDILTLIERGLRRANLPVSYSQGFNPHMLISWGPAHPVGLAGEEEYFDIEFNDIVEKSWYSKLNSLLPEGIKIIDAREIKEKLPALMSIINLATYRISFTNIGRDILEKGIDQLLSRETLQVRRQSPKGDKTVDIRPGIIDISCQGSDLIFTGTLGKSSSPRPQEVALILAPEGEIKYICRTGLFIENGDHIIKP